MRRGLAVFICISSIFFAGCATQGSARANKRADEEAAKGATLKWLKLLDDGDYEEAFEWEAMDFRISRTQKQFVRYMQGRRAPFGRTTSRTFIGAALIHKLVGAPDGDYESIVFKTTFERKSVAAERVILVKQSEHWRVIDYRAY